MTSQQLPDQPNLEQLKKQAKSLAHGARASNRVELERFRVLPAFASKSIEELSAVGLALHDAQSVIAREYGFKSWRGCYDIAQSRKSGSRGGSPRAAGAWGIRGRARWVCSRDAVALGG